MATTTVLVVDEISGRPLSNVRIEVIGNGRVVTQTTTNAQGRSPLLARGGSYCLRIEKNGYVDPLNGPASGCRAIELNGHEIVLRLVPSCSISGVVADDQGNPVQAAKVVAVSPGNLNASWAQSAGQEGRTDDRGAYRLFGLPPGRYSVAAIPSGEDTTTPPFFTTFLGARDYRQAQFLDLKSGQAAESINLVVDLHTSTRSRVTGTVLNACLPGEICHATVMLFSSNGLVSPVDQSFTDNNGNFQFDNIPVGDYFVAAWTPAVDWPSTNEFPAAIRRAAIAPISITGAEGRVEIPLIPTATITGHISATGALSDICPALDRVGLLSDDGWPRLWISAINPGNKVSWGPLPSGSYRIVAPTYPNSCKLISIRDGNRVSHGDQPVPLGTESSTLELVFRAVKGEISGVINDGAGSIPQGYVLLLGSGQSPLRRVVQVDKGHFVFTNVPRGSYSLLAFADLDSAARFSSSASAEATVITIGYAQEHVDNVVLTLR